jgi:hypothetical protein
VSTSAQTQTLVHFPQRLDTLPNSSVEVANDALPTVGLHEKDFDAKELEVVESVG